MVIAFDRNIISTFHFIPFSCLLFLRSAQEKRENRPFGFFGTKTSREKALFLSWLDLGARGFDKPSHLVCLFDGQDESLWMGRLPLCRYFS